MRQCGRETHEIRSGDPEGEPLEERLRTLYQAAYPPLHQSLEPSASLERRVKALMASSTAEPIGRVRNRHGARPVGRWPGTAVVCGAVGLLTILALMTTRWDMTPFIGIPDERTKPSGNPPSRARNREIATLQDDGKRSPISHRAAPGNRGQASLAKVTASYGTSEVRVSAVVTDPQRYSAALRSRRSPGSPRRPDDDLSDRNRDPAAAAGQWAALTPDAWDRIEAGLRQNVRVRDDFVRIPFPRLAGATDRQLVAAVEAYKREAAIADPRLAREVTVRQKATALSDLCEGLRADSGIRLTAGRSVADEKVTLFCRQTPVRDVMRQLSRPFGYTWVRTGKEGEYRYELMQDLRSQLLEEELRNRDRNAALLALERELDRFRPYLDLSPDEALARASSAAPGDRELLARLSDKGWGPIQMYFRLTPPELAALRAGQTMTFSADPKPGEKSLPPDVARGVIQSYRDWRAQPDEQNPGTFHYASAETLPDSLPLTASPEVRAVVRLALVQSELGQFTLNESGAGFTTPSGGGSMFSGLPIAVGLSADVRTPQNAVLNKAFARDPSMRDRVTVVPGERRAAREKSKRITSADVLEALHDATGLPIVSDFYTRLHSGGAVSVTRLALFDALNQLCDVMGLRWTKDGHWLQFRSAGYYHDRLKEVPNRLLSRWAASRRRNGSMTLEELVEIAGLSDAQLDASAMAEGAREYWDLEEWDVARDRSLRPHTRFLAALTPLQRQEASTPAGLPFTKMTLAQQQQFLSLALDPKQNPFESLQELSGAALRVALMPSGGFRWREPGQPPEWPPLWRPRVQESTREAALQAARRLDSRAEPGQIEPAEIAFTVMYGMMNARTGTPRGDVVSVSARGVLRIARGESGSRELDGR